MDTVSIASLELWTHIGITEEERSTEQRLLVDIAMNADLRAAGTADDIRQTIDYEHVCQSVRTIASTERHTIEKFAEDIADLILQSYQPESVEVTVKKFLIPGTESTGVRIIRP